MRQIGGVTYMGNQAHLVGRLAPVVSGATGCDRARAAPVADLSVITNAKRAE